MDEIERVTKIVSDIFPLMKVEYDVPMKNYTTFRIGGAVQAMFFPNDAASAVKLFEIFNEQGIAPFILGNGSNILASDSKLNIVVINTMGLKSIELTDTCITAESGALMSELAVFAYNHGLTGLEFAHGIPGTFGGAVVMNAGAYDGEMGNIVHTTHVYSTSRGRYAITLQEHEFSYRNSVFAHSGDMALSSSVRLNNGEKPDIKRKMDELAALRRESQPLDKPCAGSIFKRPKDGYAAALIERAGLKGYQIGGAQVSPKHSGFIVNTGDATYSDVLAVISYVQETVLRHFGVELELEVKILESSEL